MRLKEDSSSWKSRGIMRRDFRHDPGLPETEVTRHKRTRRKKAKHVHEWKEVLIGHTTTRRPYRWIEAEGRYEWVDCDVPKYQRICVGCGHRRTSTSYRYYW